MMAPCGIAGCTESGAWMAYLVILGSGLSHLHHDVGDVGLVEG